MTMIINQPKRLGKSDNFLGIVRNMTAQLAQGTEKVHTCLCSLYRKLSHLFCDCKTISTIMVPMVVHTLLNSIVLSRDGNTERWAKSVPVENHSNSGFGKPKTVWLMSIWKWVFPTMLNWVSDLHEDKFTETTTSPIARWVKSALCAETSCKFP